MTLEPTLTARHCTRKAPALDAVAIANLLHEVPGWAVTDNVLTREFKLPDYRATMALVNGVAGIAEQEDHHPDMTVGYATCRVSWTTHSAGSALSENDFICAAKANALYLDLENA
ncbi:4a-hydroxytetrahydrobiopterin dehydratase [Massilia aurea]|uniref:4a-hydroxytetrahydrobiopterin dehydratase n=1 Tax=Massilia aurea TaxID=373040 RepID=UPI00346378E6